MFPLKLDFECGILSSYLSTGTWTKTHIFLAVHFWCDTMHIMRVTLSYSLSINFTVLKARVCRVLCIPLINSWFVRMLLVYIHDTDISLTS